MSEPITERGDPRDRIANQRELFDVSRLVTVQCPICGATRTPDETKAPHCTVDRDRKVGLAERRPKACLNQPDPAHAPFPEGY